MPSSVIIVALAAAWLAVLVPMVARKRQEITQTNDSALAARVVRSGGVRSEWRREFDMTGSIRPESYPDDERDHTGSYRDIDEHRADGNYRIGYDDGYGRDDDDYDQHEHYDDGYDGGYDGGYDDGYDRYAGGYDHDEDGYDDGYDRDDDVADDEGFRFAEDSGTTRRGPAPGRRYRPGRGGFDPEAAEIAARAKYAFRQRVVFFLLLAVLVTAVIGGFVWPAVWWLHGASDLTLVAYLVYLRKQGRIEEEIRRRRLARFRQPMREAPQRDEQATDLEVLSSEHPGVVGAERNPVPTSRTRRQAVVVDPEDEDPAFHELDDPEERLYRRAVGE